MNIPINEYGIKISVAVFDFKFDLGGFAAFLLVAGLSVNAGIFIINDYLNIKKRKKNLSPIRAYVKACNAKSVPILLTGLSTCLGLIPFVIFDQGQTFWYALAICTIAGTLFSLLAVFMFLPAFIGFRLK
ncbi:MAG: efflux RND transporter permease subunit [Bacteroidota bacterium]